MFFLKNVLDGSGISRSVLKEDSRNFPKTLDLSTHLYCRTPLKVFLYFLWHYNEMGMNN